MQSRCFEVSPEGAQQILLVAEKLFGYHGLTGVSLRQITTAAGQANNSIIHHYFGSRAGLVQAVYEMRLPALDRDRQKLLDAFSSEGDPTVDQLFGAPVLPILMIKDRVTRERFSMFSAQVTNLPLEHDPFPAALRIMPAAREINRQILVKMALSAEITDVRLRLASRPFVTGVADFTRIKSLDRKSTRLNSVTNAHLFGLR